MTRVLKIVAALLFVVLVVVTTVVVVQKSMSQSNSYDRGPQIIGDKFDGVVEGEEGEPIGTTTAVGLLLESDDAVPSECTADVKMCFDGSFVSRTEENCGFAVCPVRSITVSKFCTAAQKNAEMCTTQYEPVCGLVEVQCVTTPCDPIAETFGNACSACVQGNVSTYSKGECEV